MEKCSDGRDVVALTSIGSPKNYFAIYVCLETTGMYCVAMITFNWLMKQNFVGKRSLKITWSIKMPYNEFDRASRSDLT